jgi:hypothetical protein
MFKEVYRSELHHAARFKVGMSAADVEALCVELNAGRDGTGDMAGFNGSVKQSVTIDPRTRWSCECSEPAWMPTGLRCRRERLNVPRPAVL